MSRRQLTEQFRCLHKEGRDAQGPAEPACGRQVRGQAIGCLQPGLGRICRPFAGVGAEQLVDPSPPGSARAGRVIALARANCCHGRAMGRTGWPPAGFLVADAACRDSVKW
jgi:hypothetical protein